MFLDPKRDGEVVEDVHSIASLVAWLETKKPSGKYDYELPGNCLLSQYYRDRGYKDVNVAAWDVMHDGGNFSLSEEFHDIAIGIIPGKYRLGASTFGAALRRARAQLKDQEHRSVA